MNNLKDYKSIGIFYEGSSNNKKNNNKYNNKKTKNKIFKKNSRKNSHKKYKTIKFSKYLK